MTEKRAFLMVATRFAILLGMVSMAFSFPNKFYEPVGSKYNPGESCKDILLRGGNGTGIYYISEIDFNAMDFRLWKKIGKDFMIKSNVNNWVVCSDRRGSLVHWRSGSIDCDIVNNIMLQCKNIVPDMIEVDFYNAGPNLYDDSTDSATIDTYYFFDTLTYNVESPQWEPCGMLTLLRPINKIPRANIYIR